MYAFLKIRNVNIKICKTIILSTVLYGSESCLLKLKVFKNRMLRKVYGPKKKKTTRGFRKLHNEKLPNCLSKITEDEMSGECDRHGKDE
jgi:hypothetical protein